jgi:hypothetical protein
MAAFCESVVPYFVDLSLSFECECRNNKQASCSFQVSTCGPACVQGSQRSPASLPCPVLPVAGRVSGGKNDPPFQVNIVGYTRSACYVPVPVDTSRKIQIVCVGACFRLSISVRDHVTSLIYEYNYQ